MEPMDEGSSDVEDNDGNQRKRKRDQGDGKDEKKQGKRRKQVLLGFFNAKHMKRLSIATVV
jgi:hypothetical protein